MITKINGHIDAPIKAMSWAIAGNFFYASENAIAKLLTSNFHPIQILFFYGLVMFVMASWVCKFSGGVETLKTNRPILHGIRSIVMIATFYTYILALSTLQLANVIAIMFVTPILAIIFSLIFLNEKINIYRWVAISIAITGVMFIIRPEYGALEAGVFWAILSATLAAIDTILTRKLTYTESSSTIVFYLAASYVIVTGAILPIVWVWVDFKNLMILLGMGLSGLLAQYAITHAYRYAGPPVISPLDYTMLLWGIIFGYLFWGDLPNAFTYIGSSMLIVAGLIVTYWDSKKQKAAATNGR